MSRQSSVHTKAAGSAGPARSTASLLERQHTLGRHVSVQREATGAAVHPSAPALVREVIGSSGQPLDTATRSNMEPRFGADFSQVRVHTGERAAASARAVSARAFTAGSHIVFGEDAPRPGSAASQSLLAHELTHVTQQAAGPVSATPVAEGLSLSAPDDHFEQAARASASATTRPGAGANPGAHAPAAPPQPLHGPLALQRDPLSDSSGTGPFTARQTSAAESSASAAKLSADAGAVSAGAGVFSALVGAYTGIRAANFAERSAQAAEDPPTAEPTTGGITVTDADIPEIKALDTKKIGDPTKEADSTTIQTGDQTQAPATDVTKTEGDQVETSAGKGKDARKNTHKSDTSTTDRASITTKSNSRADVFKPPDKPDQMQTYKVLNINQGANDSADFFVSIRSNGEDIKDGGTEPPEATGYLGGSTESNAAVNFKARPGAHSADGSASVRLLIGGTNTPPRKTLQSSGLFGGGGPVVNTGYAVQRFSAAVTFHADPKVIPSVDRAKGGIGTATSGDGTKDALVTVTLPDSYLPAAKRKDKK